MYSTVKTVTSVAAIVLLMTFSLTSFSQTNRFSIAINSLTTNFNYGASNSEMQSYKKNFKGLQAGVSYQVGMAPVFSIVPELYFAMKGGVLKEYNPLAAGKTTLRLYSIEMPVLARLHCNNLYLNAGPYTAYTLGGRIKMEGTDEVSESSTKVSFGNSAGGFKRWDVGLQVGAGYNFTMKKSVLTLDVRYGYGLVNISQDVDRYNRVLNISVLFSKSALVHHQ